MKMNRNLCLTLALLLVASTSRGASDHSIRSGKASSSNYAANNPEAANLLRSNENLWMSRDGTGTRGGGDSGLFNTRIRAQKLVDARDRFIAGISDIDWAADTTKGSSYDVYVRTLFLPADPVRVMLGLRIDFLESCKDGDGRSRDFVYVGEGEAICVQVGLDPTLYLEVWRDVFRLRFPEVSNLIEGMSIPASASASDVQVLLRRGFNLSLSADRPKGVECGLYDENFQFKGMPVDQMSDEVEFRRHPNGRWFVRSQGIYAFCR